MTIDIEGTHGTDVRKAHSRREGSKRRRPEARGRKTSFRGVQRLPEGGFWIRARVQDPKTKKWTSRQGKVEVATVHEAAEIRRRWTNEIEEELGEEKKESQPPMTLTVCAQRWLEECAKSGDAASTLAHKTENLEKHILPFIGAIVVQEITRKDLKQWAIGATERIKPNGERYAEETARGWWRTLQALLRWAVDEIDLDGDPTSCFKPQRYMHKELKLQVQAAKGTNALTPDEIPRFLGVAKTFFPKHYAMFVIGFFTGMRWSELTALRFDDFNLETMEIEVRRSQYRGTIRERTKNRKRRGPAFSKWMWEVVQEHRVRMLKEQAPGIDTGLCFPSETGGIRYQSLLDKPFAIICKKAGIAKKLSSKVFRRTFNDLARHAGMNELVKLAMIGHADRRMSEVYSSIDPSEKQAELAKVFRLVAMPFG
jgi:integrase